MVRTNQHVCDRHQLRHIGHVQSAGQTVSDNAVSSAREHRTFRVRFLFCGNGDQDGGDGNYWKEGLLTGQVEQTGLLHCHYWVRVINLAMHCILGLYMTS